MAVYLVAKRTVSEQDWFDDDGRFLFNKEYPCLDELTFQLIKAIESMPRNDDGHDGAGTALRFLYNQKSLMNNDRNVRVGDYFKKLFFDMFKGTPYEGWAKGEWKLRPEKVVVIIDEATDEDLVRGLVDTVRSRLAEYRGSLVSAKGGDLQIIIAGTGLDAIKYPGRMGTDPEKSSLVIMNKPDLDSLIKFGGLDEVIVQAIDEGTISRVLKTNSRMLFRGVIPVLKGKTHRVDAPMSDDILAIRYIERLRAFASFQYAMDYAPRLYVCSNSISNLDAMKRSRLLEEAFVYHMHVAASSAIANKSRGWNQKEVMQQHLSRIENLDAYRRLVQNNYDIFRRGLARQGGASSALKYLSCLGWTTELRAGFGNDFEDLVAAHVLRYFQIQGYGEKQMKLVCAWPERSGKSHGEIDKGFMQSHKKKLKEQMKKELLESSWKPSIPKGCIVFFQGTPTAQGADLFVLRWSGDVHYLDAIQCKHFKHFDNGTVDSGWTSLGIDVLDPKKPNFSPDKGKAGYSYAGLVQFRDLLQSRIGKEVQLGDRIVAMSTPAPPHALVVIPQSAAPNEGTAKIWFREMLEPTISATVISSPLDANEDSIE